MVDVVDLTIAESDGDEPIIIDKMTIRNSNPNKSGKDDTSSQLETTHVDTLDLEGHRRWMEARLARCLDNSINSLESVSNRADHLDGAAKQPERPPPLLPPTRVSVCKGNTNETSNRTSSVERDASFIAPEDRRAEESKRLMEKASSSSSSLSSSRERHGIVNGTATKDSASLKAPRRRKGDGKDASKIAERRRRR